MRKSKPSSTWRKQMENKYSVASGSKEAKFSVDLCLRENWCLLSYLNNYFHLIKHRRVIQVGKSLWKSLVQPPAQSRGSSDSHSSAKLSWKIKRCCRGKGIHPPYRNTAFAQRWTAEGNDPNLTLSDVGKAKLHLPWGCSHDASSLGAVAIAKFVLKLFCVIMAEA